MGKRMFLQLFEDGGGAGSGGQGGNAGAGNGSQGNAGGSGNQGSYSFAQAEEIANARADRAEKAALRSYFQQQGMTEQQGCSVITNADVTVYNRISGDSTHYDTWIRTVLHGVHVHVDHKTAVTDNGLKSAEVYKIRIPADIPEAGQYLPPDQFACCGGYGYWTIQNDDQIVLGEC